MTPTRPSRSEAFFLARRGATSTIRWRVYKITNVLGVHFKAGESGQPRCGSVIVTTVRGKSRYAIVERFVGCKNKLFAIVTWLSVPHYPFAPNPLVCTVRVLRSPDVHRCPVLSLAKIIPTKVAVGPCDDGVHFNMYRERGTDLI